MTTITSEQLRARFIYDADADIFIHARGSSKGARAGFTAGGFKFIVILNEPYYQQEAAAVYLHGGEIRPAYTTEYPKAVLRPIPAKPTAPFPGVSWNPKHKQWQAQVRLGARLRYMGLFPTPQAAQAAGLAARHEYESKRSTNAARKAQA